MFTTSAAHGSGRLRLNLNLPLDSITSGWEGNEPLPTNHPGLSTKQINRFGSRIHWILSWQVGRRGRRSQRNAREISISRVATARSQPQRSDLRHN